MLSNVDLGGQQASTDQTGQEGNDQTVKADDNKDYKEIMNKFIQKYCTVLIDAANILL